MKFSFNKIHDSWDNFLLDKTTSIKLKRIQRNLKGKEYYPSKNNVFRFMKNDLNNIKYIIVGMDPYPQSYEKKDNNGNTKLYPVATGRCFEPANYNSWLDKTNNTSIVNILKAIYTNETNNKDSINIIREKIENNEFNILPPHELFNYLENQGVLLLNYALTVEPNKPGSHIDIWKEFSKHLIQYIDNNYNVEWILLGNDAQQLENYITNNNVIKDVHPAISDFYLNNKCLTKINIDFTGYKKKH